MEIKDRIAKIIKKNGLTSQQFAEMIDSQSSTISHILGGRNLPSFKIIYSILDKFPEINPDWLIFGREEMFRADNKPISTPQEALEPNTSPISPISETSSMQHSTSANSPSIGMLFATSKHNDESENSLFTNVLQEGRHKGETSANEANNNKMETPSQGHIGGNNEVRDEFILPLCNTEESKNKGKEDIVEPKQLDNTPQKVMVFYKDNTFEVFTPR